MIISIALPVIDGEPTEADVAVLQDTAETYGVRRTDTLEVVVPSGTPLALDGEFYTYDFEDAIDGIEYEAQFRFEIDGDVYTAQDFFTTGSVTYPATFRAAFVDSAGEPLTPDSTPELANPTDTYGVKNLTDASVAVASGANMSEAGDGYYAYTYNALTDGNRYRFYVHAIISGVHFYLPSVTSGSARSVALAMGRYTNSYLVGQLIGHDNLYLWAGTPQQGTAELDEPVDFVNRISQFLRDAEDQLDEELLGAFVEEPWESDAVPVTIRRLATVLTAVAIYESRGVDDVGENADGPVHRLSQAKREALKTIKRIKMGLLPLTGVGYGPAVSEIDPGIDD